LRPPPPPGTLTLTPLLLVKPKDPTMMSSPHRLPAPSPCFVVPDWDHDKCADLVITRLTKDAQPAPYTLQDPEACKLALSDAFVELRTRPGWANVRDAVRMAKDVEAARETRGACVRLRCRPVGTVGDGPNGQGVCGRGEKVCVKTGVPTPPR
jgi:hypothetical protein